MTKRPFVLITVCGAALAMTTAAAAQESANFCRALTAIVAAADATPSWSGVARGDTGTVIPGPFRSCGTSSYSSSADYTCSLDLTAATVESAYQTLVGDVTACLGEASSVSGDQISTTRRWTTPGGVEVSATKVTQANANNFSIGLGVRLTF